MLRNVIAVLAGGLIAAVLYQVGAVVGFVGLYGIPLGASPDPPGSAYFAINLGFAMLAAVAGGCATARWAGSRGMAPVGVLAVVLAAVVLWGFTKPASRWPGWYPPVLALVGMGGAFAGGVLLKGRQG